MYYQYLEDFRNYRYNKKAPKIYVKRKKHGTLDTNIAVKLREW